eukprot:1087783-Pelagomonas_calceolata.AAC.1
MPNPLLLLLLPPPPPPPPPPHTMFYAAGTATHTDTRPGRQLERAQQHHADICKNINGKAVTLHTILLGVGGTCYTEHALNQLKKLRLDHQRAIKLACKLHARAIMYANKLVTTRRAIEKHKASHNQFL